MVEPKIAYTPTSLSTL